MHTTISLCTETLLVCTHMIWVICIKKGGDAQNNQRMRRGTTYAHLCDLGNIVCKKFIKRGRMRRATSACAEGLLMRTYVIWVI